MKTMGRGTLRVLVGAAVMGAAASTAPGTLSARQRTPRAESSDCRCVDRDGKEIDNCRCLHTVGPGQVMVFGQPAARARLGITVSAAQDAADDAKGARVASVMEGGPAEDAGLAQGDIITRVDGRSLFDALGPDTERDFDLDRSIPVQRLLAIAGRLDPDTDVKVEYLRDGKAHEATVHTRDLAPWTTLGAFDRGDLAERMDSLRDRLHDLGRGGAWGLVTPDAGGRFQIFADSSFKPRLRMGGPGAGTLRVFGGDSAGMRSWRCPGDDSTGLGALTLDDQCIGGLRLVQVNPGLGEYFDTDKGVLVSDVSKDSTLGLQPGDVILQIGGRDTATPDRARRILASYGADEGIDFHIVRKGKTMDVRGRLGS
jgi:membrane-associated protease RseP (regulator of RpoE activity)